MINQPKRSNNKTKYNEDSHGKYIINEYGKTSLERVRRKAWLGRGSDPKGTVQTTQV